MPFCKQNCRVNSVSVTGTDLYNNRSDGARSRLRKLALPHGLLLNWIVSYHKPLATTLAVLPAQQSALGDCQSVNQSIRDF